MLDQMRSGILTVAHGVTFGDRVTPFYFLNTQCMVYRGLLSYIFMILSHPHETNPRVDAP